MAATNRTNCSQTKDTVSLCSQTAYPGDEDLQVLETDIMTTWKLDQPPDVDASALQDPQESQKNLDLARACLGEGKQCDALVYIDLALEGGIEDPQLWLQRSTVLIALGDLREAFRSCCVLPGKDRTADLWKMGGCILLLFQAASCCCFRLYPSVSGWSILAKLGLPVTAELWFRHATQLAAPGDNSAAILFQKTRAKRLYAPLTQDMSVEVTFTSQGRAVVSRKAIKKGEVIFSDKPMLLAQTLPSMKFVCCANCVMSLIRPEDVFTKEELEEKALVKAVKKFWPVRDRFPCTCAREVYCSKQCRDEAWENHHRLICAEKNPAMEKLYEVCASYNQLTSSDLSSFEGWWAASFSPILLAKVWAQIVCSACRLAEDNGKAGRPSLQDWALARAPYRRFIAYGSGIKADSFPKMHQLMSDIFSDLGEGLRYTIDKEEFSGRYLQLACNVQSFSDGDNPMAYLCRGLHKDRDPQLRRLLDTVRRKEHEGDFAGLFPVHACLNHSCANNAVVCDGLTSEGKPGCHVKAKRDIACGEEVYNQYIDTNMSRRERRYYLYQSYNFWCQCTRCQFEGDGPTSCTECQAAAPEGKPFAKCSRCKQAWYCSPKCQKKAWKRGHKKICGLEM
ncbi:hypothetical protein ACOMHN_020213 [Nucella lapillus]